MTHNLKNIILCLSVCLFSACGMISCSEDEENPFGSVAGYVTDAESGRSLGGEALVTLMPGNHSMTVNNNGSFGFYELEPGSYTLSVSCTGYESQRKNVTVSAGMATQTDFQLVRSVGQNSLELEASTIVFDYLKSETTFRFRNAGNAEMSWDIHGVTVPWLSVTPDKGTLASGAWATVNVSVDRSAISTSATSVSSSFTVRADGSEFPVQVTVRTAPGGNEEQEKGKVSGRVVNSKDQRGVADATVILSPGNTTATTDRNGLFSVEDLMPGQYTVTATHDSYVTSSCVVTVNSGTTATANIFLDPQEFSMSVSPLELDFGLEKTSLDITVTNTGNTEAIVLRYGTTTPEVHWYKITPAESIPVGGQGVVTVTVDRSKMESANETATIVLDYVRGAQSETVTLKASKKTGTDAEDYSSASVSSCDTRVRASIVSCIRSGSTVTFSYTLTNTGMDRLNDWRIYPPHAISMISGGSYSRVWDNAGTNYEYPTMSFRDKSTSGSNVISTAFPMEVPCSGSVTVTGVPASATELNVVLGVYAYPNSQFHMSGTEIAFRNVPIY